MEDFVERIVELDASKVQDLDKLRDWALIHLDLTSTAKRGLENYDVDLDGLTRTIYFDVGKHKRLYKVRLLNYENASRFLKDVIDGPQGWRREFGAGLPRDYGTCISFVA